MVLANHLRVSQSERVKSTIHLCGIYLRPLYQNNLLNGVYESVCSGVLEQKTSAGNIFYSIFLHCEHRFRETSKYMGKEPKHQKPSNESIQSDILR